MDSNHNQKPPANRDANLERWLGRRDVFTLIAGRCSAAEAACLREIRERKLYVDSAPSWDEFCRLRLKSSRHKFDTVIRQLDEHGPQFFHANQAHRLTEPEYIALKEHFTEQGMTAGGQLILWGEDNMERIGDAIGKLRAIVAPKPAKKAVTFESLLERLDSLNTQLGKWGPLNDGQLRALGEKLLRLSNVAQNRGVKLVQR